MLPVPLPRKLKVKGRVLIYNYWGFVAIMLYRARGALRVTAIAGVVLSLSACSLFSKAPPPAVPGAPNVPAIPVPAAPTAVKGSIVASSTVNPDRTGRPSPIVLKVFELKSLAAFDKFDFFSLFERDKETLGNELAAREDFSLKPGERKEFARQVSPETRYVGVVAAFRDLERSTWRASFTLQPNKTTPFVILLDGVKASIVAIE